MSEKFKVYDSQIPTFITITTVGWVSVFTRINYSTGALLQSETNLVLGQDNKLFLGRYKLRM